MGSKCPTSSDGASLSASEKKGTEMKVDTILTNGQLVLPHQGVVPGNLLVNGGRIVGICAPGCTVPAAHRIDVEGKYIFPGIIDAHTHYGLGSADDFLTETRSAALGGVTTVLTFYQNARRYSEVFPEEKRRAEEKAHVDFSYHLCLMKDEHLDEIPRYVENFGVSSFKFFMHFRGDEGKYMGIEGTDDGFLYDGLKAIAEYPRAKAVIHAENIEIGWRLRDRLKAEGKDGLEVWTASKPDFLEVESLRRACYLAKITGCTLYLAHMTAAESCAELRVLRKQIPPVYAETCTHYLTHTAESPVGNIGKVNPPLRYPRDLEELWTAVQEGTLDVISTDHVPRKFQTKRGNIWECSAGFPGTATLLPVVLSEGYHKRGLSLMRIAELLSENPARLFNLYPRKGSLTAGCDADLTIVDIDRVREVRAGELGSYSDYSLYDGWKLTGWPVLTMVRGEVVMDSGEVTGTAGYGQFIPR